MLPNEQRTHGSLEGICCYRRSLPFLLHGLLHGQFLGSGLVIEKRKKCQKKENLFSSQTQFYEGKAKGSVAQVRTMQFYECQGSLQSALLPGIWVPKVRNAHSEEQEWSMACSQEKAMGALAKAVEGKAGYRLAKMDQSAGLVVVNFYTNAGWLDQYKFQFSGETKESCKAKVYGYSTGMLPMLIPGAPLINCLLAPIAFGDGGKVAHSLHVLSKELAKESGCAPSVQVTRYSLTNPKRVTKKASGGSTNLSTQV